MHAHNKNIRSIYSERHLEYHTQHHNDNLKGRRLVIPKVRYQGRSQDFHLGGGGARDYVRASTLRAPETRSPKAFGRGPGST